MKTNKQIFITSGGLEEVKAELTFLKNVKRAEVTQRFEQAREFGDLSENSEYDGALEDQAMLESRIADLEGIFKQAQIVNPVFTSGLVSIGSTVTLDMEGETRKYTIVGRLEVDPSKQKISNESPLGSALLGAKIGQTVEINTPVSRYSCKVLQIK